MFKENKMLENVYIESSLDYGKFEVSLLGNRKVIEANVKKLMVSMQDKQLASIAIVNNKNQIVDGQHRLAACKALGLPFYYITMPDYGIEEVHQLNTNMKNWTNEDFIRQFSERFQNGEVQYKDYYELETFMDKHQLRLGQALAILGNGKKTGSEPLRNGSFYIETTKEENITTLKELMELEYELGAKITPIAFWQAYVLCKNIKGFSANNFYMKSKRFKNEIEDCKSSVESFIEVIEAVYNDRSREPLNIAFKAKQVFKSSKPSGAKSESC